MRRAYNAGRYEEARRHARLLLSNPKERALARSVLVRSYWNEQAFETLVETAEHWDDELSQSYVALAQEQMSATPGKALTPMKESRLERLRDAQPQPKHSMEWNPDNMPPIFPKTAVAFGSGTPKGTCIGTCLLALTSHRPIHHFSVWRQKRCSILGNLPPVLRFPLLAPLESGPACRSQREPIQRPQHSSCQITRCLATIVVPSIPCSTIEMHSDSSIISTEAVSARCCKLNPITN